MGHGRPDPTPSRPRAPDGRFWGVVRAGACGETPWAAPTSQNSRQRHAPDGYTPSWRPESDPLEAPTGTGRGDLVEPPGDLSLARGLPDRADPQPRQLPPSHRRTRSRPPGIAIPPQCGFLLGAGRPVGSGGSGGSPRGGRHRWSVVSATAAGWTCGVFRGWPRFAPANRRTFPRAIVRHLSRQATAGVRGASVIPSVSSGAGRRGAGPLLLKAFLRRVGWASCRCACPSMATFWW